MPMGIVSDSDFEVELANHVNRRLKPNNGNEHGRGNVKEVPESLRELVAADAINGVPASELSEVYGISKSSISAYKNSATSTSSYHSPVQNLLNKNERVREVIFNKSKRVMLRAMNHITDQKLDYLEADKLSTVAKNMSGIMSDMTPKVDINQNVQNQVVVYRPRIKDEDEFEIIDVID